MYEASLTDLQVRSVEAEVPGLTSAERVIGS